MLNLFSVAVTGSIASGKSTVCQFFERWGARVVDADRLLHQVFSKESSVEKKICSLFGESILSGSFIDRAKIAKIVFSQRDLLDKLEDICHPYVNQAIKEEYAEALKGDFAFFVAEIPLLFESRYPLVDWFDATVLVATDPDKARKRSKLQKEDYDRREGRLLSQEEKAKEADFVVSNNGSLKDLEENAKKLFENFKFRNISQQQV